MLKRVLGTALIALVVGLLAIAFVRMYTEGGGFDGMRLWLAQMTTPLDPLATHHLGVRIADRGVSRIEGTDFVGAIVYPDEMTLAIYVSRGSRADKLLNAGYRDGSIGSIDATLLVDGKPVAKGLVAANYNVEDSEGGPVPGQTGFFYYGSDYFAIYKRIVDLPPW